MIKVCIADSQPVVHFGLSSFFANSSTIEIVQNFHTFDEIPNYFVSNTANILIIDAELNGFLNFNLFKVFIKKNPRLSIVVYTNLSESVYAHNFMKVGVAAFVSKTSAIDNLSKVIEKVAAGEKVFSNEVKEKMNAICKNTAIERINKKLSNRELEVLRHLSIGKKNNEVAIALGIDEKTVSTYKRRLLQKLQVTNLIDLIKKAASLDILNGI